MSASHPEFGHDTTAEEVATVFAHRIGGRIFLLTGPSPNGLGDATLRALARGGPASLLLVGRNPSKYTEVVDALHSINPTIRVVVYAVDLASIASVRTGAANILAENSRIDVVINSAGVLGTPKVVLTQDGIEEHFATNHVGPFLLTSLLAPALRRSDEPRVVNVSGGLYAIASGDYSDYNFAKREYSALLAYAQSKLANIHFATALARRGIVALSLHPGVIWGTNLTPDIPEEDLAKLQRSQSRVITKTSAQGASTIVVAALDPNASSFNGGYLSDCQVEALTGPALTSGAADQLWKLTEELVGETFPFAT